MSGWRSGGRRSPRGSPQEPVAEETDPIPTNESNLRGSPERTTATSGTEKTDDRGVSLQSAVASAEITVWPSSQPIVVGRPTPAFEPKAPGAEYRSTPYRPDTTLDGWSTEFFTIRAATMRGHLHRYNGTPRQDDFALILRRDNTQIVAAIADGVSSAKHSHIGSTTAVRYALQWLDASIPESTADINWKALVESTAWALIEQAEAIFSLQEPNAEQAEKLLATTLVCAVIEPNCAGGAVAHVVSVGDSGAWILSEGSFIRVDGGGKDASVSGVSSSAVSGLPRIPADVGVTTITLQRGEVLLLGTDGFGDPLGGGAGEVGRLFASVLGDRVPSIIEFAHALDFSRETFDDDRTLVAVWLKC